MKLILSPEHVETLEIALNEMLNSDIWIRNREENEINKIADRVKYLLHLINQNKTKIKWTS